jgi:adenosylcobinamide-GDP ribazoletransferase
MTTSRALLDALANDLKISIAFCTRLPICPAKPVEGKDVARASWAFPVAGALVGMFGALIYWLAFRMGLPSAVSAALGVAVTLITTGCLHEDALADTADGFGGGKDAAEKLQIMRDSRVGTYGACALVLSILIRWSAIAAIAEPSTVAIALIAAHASARAPMPILMGWIPQARRDGLAAAAGTPPPSSAIAAAMLGVVLLIFAFGLGRALILLLLLTLATVLLGWLSMRQIGGQTGDVIGALEQFNEMLILLVCAAIFTA